MCLYVCEFIFEDAYLSLASRTLCFSTQTKLRGVQYDSQNE